MVFFFVVMFNHGRNKAAQIRDECCSKKKKCGGSGKELRQSVKT